MKGYRTIAFNLATGIVGLIAATDFSGVVSAETLAYVVMAQSLANVALRTITTTPVFKRE